MQNEKVIVTENPDGTKSTSYYKREFITDVRDTDGLISAISYSINTVTSKEGRESLTYASIDFRDCGRSISWSFRGSDRWDDSDSMEGELALGKIKRARMTFNEFAGIVERTSLNSIQAEMERRAAQEREKNATEKVAPNEKQVAAISLGLMDEPVVIKKKRKKKAVRKKAAKKKFRKFRSLRRK